MPASLQDATWEEVLLDLVPSWISRTHTLEQMLIEIGEPVYRWKRKEVVE